MFVTLFTLLMVIALLTDDMVEGKHLQLICFM